MIVQAGLAALCLALALVIVQVACVLGLARAAGTSRALAAVTGVQAVLLMLGSLLAWDGAAVLKVAVTIIVAVSVVLLNAWNRRSAVARAGARVAWIGAILAVAGAIASHSLSSTAVLSAAPGEQVRFQNWTIELHDVNPAVGPEWSGFEGEARATRGDGVQVLKPQLQYRLRPATTRRKSAGAVSWDGELRVALGEAGTDRQWPLRIEWRPFVSLVSSGALVAALGALIALLAWPIAVRRRARRIHLARAWWA